MEVLMEKGNLSIYLSVYAYIYKQGGFSIAMFYCRRVSVTQFTPNCTKPQRTALNDSHEVVAKRKEQCNYRPNPNTKICRINISQHPSPICLSRFWKIKHSAHEENSQQQQTWKWQIHHLLR